MTAVRTGHAKMTRLQGVGEVRMLEFMVEYEGKQHRYWDYDPDFAPAIPAGALRGDLHKQNFCRMCNAPFYYYVDEQKTCRDCGRTFTFGAAEQKHWYEELQFHPSSEAVRCLDCRRRRRAERAEKQRRDEVIRRGAASDADAETLLALARVTCEHVRHAGGGKIDRAIAAARKAYRLDPTLNEALLVEAEAQALAGRRTKAVERLEDLLAASPEAALADEARRRLGELTA